MTADMLVKYTIVMSLGFGPKSLLDLDWPCEISEESETMIFWILVSEGKKRVLEPGRTQKVKTKAIILFPQ